jgi:hypothetical protein
LIYPLIGQTKTNFFFQEIFVFVWPIRGVNQNKFFLQGANQNKIFLQWGKSKKKKITGGKTGNNLYYRGKDLLTQSAMLWNFISVSAQLVILHGAAASLRELNSNDFHLC